VAISFGYLLCCQQPVAIIRRVQYMLLKRLNDTEPLMAAGSQSVGLRVVILSDRVDTIRFHKWKNDTF
jgi:hypothetical protein